MIVIRRATARHNAMVLSQITSIAYYKYTRPDEESGFLCNNCKIVLTRSYLASEYLW